MTDDVRIKQEEEDDDYAVHGSSILPVPERSGVNGQGMWHSWERSFHRPALALLDLFDNAMDATMASRTGATDDSFSGRIDVSANVHDDDEPTRDVCLMNNCRRRMAPLVDVLQIHKSIKNTHQYIGENGVGVKQACASLSKLSFVLTKNNKKYGLGMISYYLQDQDSPPDLPSYEFVLDGERDLQQTLERMLKSRDAQDLWDSVQRYGCGHVEKGLQRLVGHYQRMSTGVWADEPYVFLVVLHDMTHHGGKHDILEEFASELPRNYLHVPDNFVVKVQDRPILFQYWERRLVELTKFTSRFDSENSWRTAEDWLWPMTGYAVNIYLGFDPRRADTARDNKASLFIYTRSSGRLIKHVQDARSVLNLDCGGTTYAQGLTILLDDVHGRLPLTPTKQDLAFAHQATHHGNVHEANVYAWIGAYAHFFYNEFLGIYHKRKRDLGLGVLSHLDTVEAHAATTKPIKSLLDGDFNTFQNISFRRVQNRIRASTRKAGYQQVRGVDTLFQLDQNPALPPATARSPAKRKRTSEARNDEPPLVVSPTSLRPVGLRPDGLRPAGFVSPPQYFRPPPPPLTRTSAPTAGRSGQLERLNAQLKEQAAKNGALKKRIATLERQVSHSKRVPHEAEREFQAAKEELQKQLQAQKHAMRKKEKQYQAQYGRLKRQLERERENSRDLEEANEALNRALSKMN